MQQNRDFYEQFGIFELRKIARDKAVRSPTNFTRDKLISQIIDIENGVQKPYINKSLQGRPHKVIHLPNLDKDCTNCIKFLRFLN